MKLSQIKTVSKDSLSKAGELPKWIDALLQPLNQFIENVGQALQGQLTFKENFLCKVTTERMAHGAETEVNPYTSAKQKTLKVTGVILLDSGGAGVDKFRWVRKSDGNISVTVHFDGGITGQVSNCTLLILLG